MVQEQLQTLPGLAPQQLVLQVQQLVLQVQQLVLVD